MEWRFEYPARVERDEGGFFLVTFPDFPEAATDSRSLDQVPVEAVDCLEEAVAGRIKRGEDIPRSSRAEPNSIVVALPALYALKAALYLAAREARLSHGDLAAKLGKKKGEVERLLDPSQPSPAPALEAALRTVGKRVQVTIEDTDR